jgi:MFS family permease
MNPNAGLNRSLKFYTFFAVAQGAYFWSPVFFLYFASIVSLSQVFLLEAVYYAAVVVTEVPSGYFSDRIGRRWTLLLSSTFLVISYGIFGIARSFAALAAAQVFLASGFAFASGSDTALHYGLLKAVGKDSEYGLRESRIGAWVFRATAFSALTGGFLAWRTEFRTAYWLSLFFAVVSLVLILLVRDPETANLRHSETKSFVRQVRELIGSLRNPVLGFLFFFAVASTVLRHLPYEFFQVYIDHLGQQFRIGDATPLFTGIHTAIAMLIASGVVRFSIPLKDRIGSTGAFFSVIGVQTILIAILLVPGSSVVATLLLLRSAPGSMGIPILRAEVSPRVQDSKRATFYSLQSLVGRLSFSGVLLVFNQISNKGIRLPVTFGTILGVLALTFLIILATKNRKHF